MRPSASCEGRTTQFDGRSAPEHLAETDNPPGRDTYTTPPCRRPFLCGKRRDAVAAEPNAKKCRGLARLG